MFLLDNESRITVKDVVREKQRLNNIQVTLLKTRTYLIEVETRHSEVDMALRHRHR